MLFPCLRWPGSRPGARGSELSPASFTLWAWFGASLLISCSSHLPGLHLVGRPRQGETVFHFYFYIKGSLWGSTEMILEKGKQHRHNQSATSTSFVSVTQHLLLSTSLGMHWAAYWRLAVRRVKESALGGPSLRERQTPKPHNHNMT